MTGLAEELPALRAATAADAVRFEWTKLTTLRSTGWTLLATVVLGVGFAVLFGLGGVQGYLGGTPDEQAAFDPTAVSLRSHLFTQLAVAVLGVLAVTGEYATGTVQSSLAAVPRRHRLLVAKVVVVGAVGLVVGELVGFASFLVGQAILGGRVPSAVLDEPGVLRAVLGCGLYLALVGVAGVAVGVLVRASAGAVTAMLAGTLLVPAFTPILPTAVARVVGRFWPTLAGDRIMTVRPDPDVLPPWAGLGVLAAWVAALLAAAFVVLRRRDA